jgi:hypothetical protein
MPKCQLCEQVNNSIKITPAIYDAKTLQGYWAYVCQYHFDWYCYTNPGLSTILKKD